MVDLKDAVTNAVAFARSVLERDRVKDLLVEEVERSTKAGRDIWLITLSLPKTGNELRALFSPLNNRQTDREYKTFAVDAETGEVLSMKIRDLSVVR
jgi:hypothetical protein